MQLKRKSGTCPVSKGITLSFGLLLNTSESGNMRSFIAVQVPEALSAYDISQIRKHAKVSIVPPGNRHITLAFLGDISEDDAKIAEYCLRSIDIKPFTVSMTGIGTFDDRVVFIEGESDELIRIQSRLTDLLTSEGIAVDRKKFVIHATLCRVKEIKSKHLFANFIKSCQNSFQTVEFNVESIVLYRSTLSQSGAQYTPLYRLMCK